ncbi:DUF6371 domain-containing protein [Runella sp.]|uniref:DUF6371 domain-containing protein n=1 Tax=Runella sp. TaxID=1960881 RepID=UPI00301ACE24
MSEYRYQFKPYKSPSDKETCPACLHKRKWTRYIDTTKGELLQPQYGKCDRPTCGHALSPYKDGYAKAIREAERANRPADWKPKPIVRQPTPPPPKPVFIPNEMKEASLKAYHQNNFVKYLQTLFDASDVQEVTERYQIGTSSRWEGSTVFWYIDLNANVRAGQVKCFDDTGHTIKDRQADGETKSRTTWVHSLLKYKQPRGVPSTPVWLSDYLNQENKVGCLFGEHLLKSEPTKVVCVVESPKTAIIASLYFPNFVWLAVGALTYLTADRCKALTDGTPRGRNVILWPDLNGYDLWKERANKLSADRWKVSDFLEQVATNEERSKGLDLADYLPRYHYKDFRLGFPHQWNDPAPVGYVPQCTLHTPKSLGLIEATGPPMTEQDLINIFEKNKHLQK